MKKIIGISLSSSDRDHNITIELNNKEISIERIGTNGDFAKARKLLKKFDGTIDAFGLGGIDLTLGIKKRYKVKDAYKLIKGLKTRVFDGNGIKHILDKKAVDYLSSELNLKNKKVFMVCASNRIGMAKAFEGKGSNMIYGDLMFGLKIPLPVRSLKLGAFLAGLTLPIATKLPYRFLYPIGKTQNTRKIKYSKYFLNADIIAGDFHYIKKYSPDNLKGKIILTTTTTKRDIIEMKKKGVSKIITTTPEIEGRCFGSNIIEAILFSICPNNDFIPLLEKFKPTVN